MLRAAPVVFALVLLLPTSGARAADLHDITGFDEYAEEHPETAEALSRRPSLAADKDFLRRHPSLASYLQSHPSARTEMEDFDDGMTPPSKPKKDDDETKKRAPHGVHHVFTPGTDDAD
jgi:hypothetical protein